MKGPILTVNPGSSSLKLRLLGADDALLAERSADTRDMGDELSDFLAAAPRPVAAGVRVVHGGSRFRAAIAVDEATADAIAELSDLAPLHNPPALEAIRRLLRLHPQLPVVACFDTAFFATLPEPAAVYAVPWRWTEEWGLRRFGFHGLSHAYASRRAAEMLGRPPAELRIVTCHLGAGASLAAVREGAAVDTTMGFTPMEGLVMATRSGSVDPGAILWLQRAKGLSAIQLEEALERHSGLLSLSGVSSGMGDVLSAAREGDQRAALAVDVYVHRLRALIASMTAALGGLDVIVFTGGVGENVAEVRSHTVAGLKFLGVAVDEARNREATPDCDVSARDSRARTLVITAREDLEIAHQARAVLG